MRTTTSFSVLIALLLLPSLCFGHQQQTNERGQRHASPRHTHHYGAEGFLDVVNPNQVALVLRVDDKRVGVVQPGTRVRFGPFAVGRHQLVTRFVDSERDRRVTVSKDTIRIDRRHPTRFKMAALPAAAPVTIRNLDSRSVTLRADGQFLGRIAGGQSDVFFLPTGPVVIEAIQSARRGKRQSRFTTVNVDFFDGAKLRIVSLRDGRRGGEVRHTSHHQNCATETHARPRLASSERRYGRGTATRR